MYKISTRCMLLEKFFLHAPYYASALFIVDWLFKIIFSAPQWDQCTGKLGSIWLKQIYFICDL